MRIALYTILTIILSGCDLPGKYETVILEKMNFIIRTNTVTGEVCLIRTKLADIGKEKDDRLEIVNCTR